MAMATRPELPADTGAARAEWMEIADRMTASERHRKNLAAYERDFDVLTQRANAHRRQSSKRCIEAMKRGEQVVCGFSTCDGCGWSA